MLSEKDFVTRSEFGRLVELVEENTKITKELEKNSVGVIEAFSAAAGAFRTLEMIGRLAKPFTYIGGAVSAIVAVYVNFKSGK